MNPIGLRHVLDWAKSADRPARHLAAFFALNLVCLSLTLSRTAVVGALAALGLSFLLARRSRVFSVVSAVAAVALLYAATSVQSHAVRESVRREVERITSSTPEGQAASKAARQGRAAGGSTSSGNSAWSAATSITAS